MFVERLVRSSGLARECERGAAKARIVPGCGGRRSESLSCFAREGTFAAVNLKVARPPLASRDPLCAVSASGRSGMTVVRRPLVAARALCGAGEASKSRCDTARASVRNFRPAGRIRRLDRSGRTFAPCRSPAHARRRCNTACRQVCPGGTPIRNAREGRRPTCLPADQSIQQNSEPPWHSSGTVSIQPMLKQQGRPFGSHGAPYPPRASLARVGRLLSRAS